MIKRVFRKIVDPNPNLIKKINVKQIDQYQSLLGCLPQENLFITDSIKKNIAFGEEEINEKKPLEDIKKSNCLEFVNKLKNKKLLRKFS